MIIKYKQKKFATEKINNLFGYITIDSKNTIPIFKIMDLRETEKKAQKGSKCIDKQKSDIIKYYNIISNKKIEVKKKEILCNDLEVLFRRKDEDSNDKRWFLNSIQYDLYLLNNKN